MGFSSELVQFRGHILFKTMFKKGKNSKAIKVRYVVVNSHSSYNIIIDRMTFNTLEEILSTLNLTMKYPLDNSRVGVVKEDQEVTRKCYQDSLKIKKKKGKNGLLKIQFLHHQFRRSKPKIRLHGWHIGGHRRLEYCEN